ncbi:MAG: winged helix-turn-helix transcriptional regulator [ANME-2 cluster archaeon]|nr:winged helix-turn-helix transcriptional regulator [ANME-2 cluster archaeon]MBC2702834.1 winged helix-turn-helix transcriptional regulator [ANME-2 cluster archaeon]MBC2708053.1 winged helix-turn-helix transcriptional regulator [ANME-2 cluster archaeon]
MKIIETFAENYNDKLYAADIVRMTDVHKATVHSHLNKLLDEGLIEKIEKIGNIQFYQLNLDNPKAKIILMLESYIVSERLEKLAIENLEKEIEVSSLTLTTPELTASKSVTSDPVYNELSSHVDIYKKNESYSIITKLITLKNYMTNFSNINDISKTSKGTTYG